jgi:hypothetical protein
MDWIKYASIHAHGKRVSETGAIIYDLGNLDADRYRFDFKYCKRENGWRQYDTNQDAWYFGVWVHEGDRVTVTYCEGDLTMTHSPDGDTFRRELASMAEFYGDPPPAAVAIDADGKRTEYYDTRPTGEGVL